MSKAKTTPLPNIECEKLCRICGCLVNNEKSLLPLYDDSSSFKQIAEKIGKYLPIKLNANDNLPKKLCMNCLNIISSWHILYTCCLETEQKIQSLNKDKQFKKVSDIFEDVESNRCYFCQYKASAGAGAGADASAGDKTDLENHLKEFHCKEIFCCDVCNTYRPRVTLLRHMNQHALNLLPTVEPEPPKHPHACTMCEKTFANVSGIKYHMNAVHNDVKNFECENCNQKFSCKRILANHIRSMHIKKNDYVCNICSKAFKTDSSLYIHKKSHSTNRPFLCALCKQTFKFKHHYASHMKKHGKNKDFECNFCHKKFFIQNLLAKHMKIHTENQVYNCHICGAKLQQKRYLRQHMKRVHRMV